MNGRDRAYVAHCLKNRLRITIPGRRGDRCYFSNLQRSLSAHADVLKVGVNPLAASVVIRCRESFNPTCLDNPFLGLALVESATRKAPALVRSKTGFQPLPGPEPDLGSVASKLVIALLTRQLGAQLIEFCVEALVAAAIKRAKVRRFDPLPKPVGSYHLLAA
jgi:hypothetical protein